MRDSIANYENLRGRRLTIGTEASYILVLGHNTAQKHLKLKCRGWATEIHVGSTSYQ